MVIDVYPDNPKREERLKNLGTQIEELALQIKANSSDFETNMN